MIKKEYFKIGIILLLSVTLILFTQWVKLLFNPESTPITNQTFIGLGVLWIFSILGVIISNLIKKQILKY